MNYRDTATSVYLELERITIVLDDITNCGDIEEAIADTQEVVCDVRDLMERLNLDFQLNIDEL